MKKEENPCESRAFQEICRSAAAASAHFGMLEAGDRVLVGLSGGKDSMLLALVLHELQKKAPFPFSLFCATFDPGFDNLGTEKIAAFAKERNWDFRTVKLDLGQIIAERHWEKSPCVLCSRLRRGKLSGLAEELHCNKLALGHHADDLAISFWMSVLRGQGITTMGPNVEADSGKLRLIRPLATTAEKDIVECARLFDLPRAGECRYKEQLADGDRLFFRHLLAEVEERIPDFRSQMLASLSRVEVEHLLDLRFLPHRKEK